MDHYPTLDQGSSSLPPGARGANAEIPPPLALVESKTEPLRFPAEDGGHSLTEMAKRDLDATLQLLAERAQYITGASSASIALREGGEMTWRASAGKAAPAIAARLETGSSLAAESVRTRQVARCADASHDPRVSRENCQARGIASIIAMPVLRQGEVAGVFELLSGQPNAFDEREGVVLERLADMVQTAIDHAEAAQRAQSEIVRESGPGLADENELGSGLPPESENADSSDIETGPGANEEVIQPVERGKIGSCSVCGFPISQGRTLCLDCEKVHAPRSKPAADQEPDPLPALGGFGAESESWLQSHKYLFVAFVVLAALIATLLYLTR
jgi:putative methionine-R-sulfoxide reductase with GAF domain